MYLYGQVLKLFKLNLHERKLQILKFRNPTLTDSSANCLASSYKQCISQYYLTSSISTTLNCKKLKCMMYEKNTILFTNFIFSSSAMNFLSLQHYHHFYQNLEVVYLRIKVVYLPLKTLFWKQITEAFYIKISTFSKYGCSENFSIFLKKTCEGVIMKFHY